MSEFRSRIEDIKPATELDFEETPGFGRWRQFFPPEAVSHPAKANLNLIEFLIKEFTREGDLILDPMAGTGSTCVLASLMGRDSICIDIEEKFVKWMEEAKKLVESYKTLTPKGTIIVFKGDARRLSEFLGNVNVVLTSPPYADSISRRRRGSWQMSQDTVDTIIANLPMGAVDVVLTSPPYADSNLSGGDPQRRAERLKRAGYDPKEFLGGRARNAMLKHYSDLDETIKRLREYGRSDPKQGGPYGRSLAHPYSQSGDNIGNLPLGDVDVVLTSPTYAGANRGGVQNIGSQRGETYLEAMMKVYSEMYSVLRPGGLAIIIVKPYVRKKRVVDLPYYTYLLLRKAGFSLEKVFKLRLHNRSFWRILYEKKYPDVPRIRHEYILVCRK